MSTSQIRVSVRNICLSLLLVSAVWAEPAPQLDGFTDDPIWATQARSWTLVDPEQPEAIGRFYLAYDDFHLYFAADVHDLDVIGSNRTPKSRVWEDDSVCLLLHLGDPHDTQWSDRTFAYTFGALGGATWSRGPLSASPDAAAKPVWPPDWVSAVTWAAGLKPGTLPNVTGNRDGGYAIEARIPWSELGVRPPFQLGSTMQICILNMNRPQMNRPGGKPLSTVHAARELNPQNPSQWERVRMDWMGPLPIRGLVEPLPLWLGSEEKEFESYKSAESDAQGPWLNRNHWTKRLNRMRAENLNTLLLRHPGPLSGLLEVAPAGQKPDTQPKGLPQGAFDRPGWFGPSEYERHRDQFRWILAEAKKHNVNVYLMLDDGADLQSQSACSPPGAQTSAAPPDAPTISRAVTRLFELYPDLAGMAAGNGYNSPTILQSFADASASRLSARESASDAHGHAPAPASAPAAGIEIRTLPIMTARPVEAELLIWTAGIDPAVARRIIDTYPNTQLLHSLQAGNQWVAPLADRGIATFNSETSQLQPEPGRNPIRSIALGSLRGTQEHLFWGDPQWMRNVLLDVRNQGIQGFLLDLGTGSRELAREAMAAYAYNAGQQFSWRRWEAHLQTLGVETYAGQLLEAIQHASAIMPEVQLLLNDSSGRFRPQYGVLLTHCLNMPTYSPATIGVDAAHGRGLLIAPPGSAWPSPVWNRRVAGISAEVGRSSATDAVPASEIIANVGKHVQACNAALTTLRHLPPKSQEQAQALEDLLNAIELNAAVGDYLTFKLRAALAWEQYKARRGRKVDFSEPLSRSVEAFRKVVQAGTRLEPEALAFWEHQIVSPPPWTAEFMQRRYGWVRTTWADRLHPLERELDIIQRSSASEGLMAALPLWDVLHAASSDKRQTRVVIDFEKPDQRYQLSEAATLTSEPEHRITGQTALLIDTRNLPSGFHEVLTTDVGTVPLVGFLHYEVAIAYRVIDPGPGDAPEAAEPFEIGFRPSTGHKRMGDHRCWTAPKNHVGVRVLQVPPPEQDGNIFYVATRAPSAIIVDHIQISQVVE